MALVLMHMRGSPKSMQKGPFASNVMRDVTTGLQAALARADSAGIARSQILLDPGIGFGKKHEQSLQVLAHFAELAQLQRPLVWLARRENRSSAGRSRTKTKSKSGPSKAGHGARPRRWPRRSSGERTSFACMTLRRWPRWRALPTPSSRSANRGAGRPTNRTIIIRSNQSHLAVSQYRFSVLRE